MNSAWDMSDTFLSAQPPAKRVCLEAPNYAAFERPGTPIDDLDDDLYDTTPVKALSPHVRAEDTRLPKVGTSSEPSLTCVQIPGLRLLDGTHQNGLFPDGNGTPNEEETSTHGDRRVYQQHEPEGGDKALDARLGDITRNIKVVGDAESLYGDQKMAEMITNGETSTRSEGPSNPSQIGNVTAEKAPALTENFGDQESARIGAAQSIPLKAKDDAKAEFSLTEETHKEDEDAEWQLDSSDTDLSSATSSDESSEDGSDDGEGALLGPEEQARILMQADVDEDPSTAEANVLRTKNESEEKYEKPNINVTADMKITELGNVESIVENMVLIKANVSGEYQVLEAGSVLCLEDRSVMGIVAETLGRVHEPRYLVGFSDVSDIASSGVEKDTTIFYVDQHSTFVFTQPLQGLKGTDASNVHDEEVGPNEIEFSDDEAEAEYKRNLKQAKKARVDARRGPQQTEGAHRSYDAPATMHSRQYQSGGLNYSDDEDIGMYKPLARPDHFEDIVGAGAPIEDRSHVKRGSVRANRGWGDRGRGSRGRGGLRSDRGSRHSRPPERHGRQQDHNRHDHVRPDNRPPSSRSPSQHHVSTSPNHHAAPSASIPTSMPPSTSTSPFVNSQSFAWNQADWLATGTSNPQYPQNPLRLASPGGSIPAGAYVNPAFFPQQPSQTAPQGSGLSFQGQWQTSTQHPNWAALAQFFQTASQNPPQPPVNGNVQTPNTQAAYMAAQQQLELLRALGRGSGSS